MNGKDGIMMGKLQGRMDKGEHYCKSTNFAMLLYLANLANCVSSLVFVAANIYIDCTLHRRAAGRCQI